MPFRHLDVAEWRLVTGKTRKQTGGSEADDFARQQMLSGYCHPCQASGSSNGTDYLASFAHLNPRSINAVFGSKWVRLAARKTTLIES